MTGMWRVRPDGDSCVSRVFAGKAFLQDTRKIFCSASLSSLIHTFCAYTIYTHITHKYWGVLLRKNPSQTTWELEIVIPINLYTFVLRIFSSHTSPFPYHWEVDSPNTYHTLWECQVRFGVAGKHWKKPRMADATWSLLRDPKSKIRHNSEKPCWSRSLEGLGTEDRLGLEGLLLTHVSQLIV